MILESVISFILTAFSPSEGTAGYPVDVQWTPTYAPADSTVAAWQDSVALGGIWNPDQPVNNLRQDAVHFRWNKYRYESSYLDNADAAKRIRTMLEEIGYEHVDSVIVTSYASPEGVYEHNQWLAKKRAKEFENVVKEELGLDESGLNVIVRPGGEAWALLRERIVADQNVSDVARKRILKLLDNDSIGWDTKKWRMEHGRLGWTRQEGDVYRWLLKNHYRYLRSLAVDIYVSKVLVVVDGGKLDVVPEEPTSEPEVVIISALQEQLEQEATVAADTTVAAPADTVEAVIAPVHEPADTSVYARTDTTMAAPVDTVTAVAVDTTRAMRTVKTAADHGQPLNLDSLLRNGLLLTHDWLARLAPKQETVGDPDAFEPLDEEKTVDRIERMESVQLLEQEQSRELAEKKAAGASKEAEEGEELPFWPIIGIGTNLLYDFTYIPNYGFTSIPSLTLEYYPAGGNVTIGADVEWPNWQHAAEHRFMQIHNLTLWGRYYFKPEQYRFNGWYVSGSANGAMFGLGWDKKGWEGEGLGLSVGGGHKWTFGRIYIDAGLSLGVFYARYDSYTWGNDATGWYYYDYVGDPDDFSPRMKRWLWLGPTRLQVTIGVDLFNRNRKRNK